MPKTTRPLLPARWAYLKALAPPRGTYIVTHDEPNRRERHNKRPRFSIGNVPYRRWAM